MNAILQKTNAYAGMATSKEEAQERRISIAKREELARFASRRWKAGDVYSPHDLSPDEMLKWSEPQKPTKDIIDILGINPLDHYKVGRGGFFSVNAFYGDIATLPSLPN